MSSSLVSAVPQTRNVEKEVLRQSANYHPSVWGDYFVTHAFDQVSINEGCREEVETLKEQVRQMLMLDNNFVTQKFNLIDAIQRLGIAYHFEGEIEALLHQIFNTHIGYHNDDGDGELYVTALRFRLLREHGYNVSPDIFIKFKDTKTGNFKEILKGDTRGMLSLYEAAHLKVHGEDILDQALHFTRTALESTVGESEHIKHALRQPLRRTLTHLEARRYMSIYTDDELLLKLAKLDFNIVQKQHQMELRDISMWWKKLEVERKLPFARDRIVECYFWITGVYFEPHYALGRTFMTKVIAMTSIIDDIYDLYGTPHELDLFTNAIDKWDIKAVEEMPEYMKPSYQALLDVYDKMEKDLAKEGKPLYPAHYAKQAMKTLVKAYYAESKWLDKSRKMPTMEEYMKVALVTSAYPMLTATSFVGMGDHVTREAFEWLQSTPKIIQAASLICRLMDDIVSHKLEQEREHIPSAVECYMKEYGVTEMQACKVFNKQVEDAWLDINQALLEPNHDLPSPNLLLTRILNLSRVINLLYKDKDNYTHSSSALHDSIASLLVHPVPL